MANHEVIVCCWRNGHETRLIMNLREEHILAKKINKHKVVCPVCRNAGHGNCDIFIKSGKTVLYPGKLYQCENGHVNVIAPIGNDIMNIQFNNESFNVNCTIEKLSNMIDTKRVICQHSDCHSSLKPVDDFILSSPVAPGIRTKTRVGDLWDRAGIEPVRSGHYDQTGDYVSTKTEIANKKRLSKVRERNISENRLPGKRIDKPTDRIYNRRNKI